MSKPVYELSQAHKDICVKHGFFQAANIEDAERLANLNILKPGTTQNIFHDARYEIMTLIAKSENYANSNLRKHVKGIELNYGKESPQGQAFLAAVKAVMETLCTIDSIKIIAKARGFTKSQTDELLTMYDELINGVGELNSFVFRIEGFIQKIEQDGYYLLAQSHATNKLQKKLTERLNNETQIDLFGNGSIISKDFKLFIKGYSELLNGVNQSAAMLLDSLMIKATEIGLQDTLIKLPLKEYMAMRGLKDQKETRRQVKEDISAIERISFEYKGTGKQRGAWFSVSIYGGTKGQIKNGDIIFRFNQDFYDSFKAGDGNRYLYMYFPREALQGNIKYNPWKYWLARKISEHKRMNIGKPNENVIGIKTLINACPNFPTYEEIIKGARQVSKRIIEPFERDLDALSPSLSWEYQNLQASPNNYTDFINENIVIHWRAYPLLPQIEAGKRKRAARQQSAKNKEEQK